MYNYITQIHFNSKVFYIPKECMGNCKIKVMNFLRQFCGNHFIILVNYKLFI